MGDKIVETFDDFTIGGPLFTNLFKLDNTNDNPEYATIGDTIKFTLQFNRKISPPYANIFLKLQDSVTSEIITENCSISNYASSSKRSQ